VGLTYDAGALVAADRNDRRLVALHLRALERGVVPDVPVGVLGQSWRGGPQAALSRILRSCRVVALDDAGARRSGALCAAAGTSDVVDATVVDHALSLGDIVVTSDPGDLRRLAAAAGRSLDLVTL
jgi:hypothetical protein